MQSSLKKSLYLGLAALSFAGVAAVSTTASAKSYATAGAYSTLKTDATKRNVEATGTNALYTKPGTVKGAKVVASKATMAKLASSKKSADYFRAYGVKTTNRGSVYYRVVSMDGKYRGYIYGGKSDTAFAGGIKSAETTTTATNPTKTTGYYLKDASKNTLWTAPKYTQYKASKVSLYGAKSDDTFTVSKAATKTREGSLYYYVTDDNNSSIAGWIYAGKGYDATITDSTKQDLGGLSLSASDAAATENNSVKINYIAKNGNTVATSTFVTKENGTKAGQSAATTTNNNGKTLAEVAKANVPSGYTLTADPVVTTNAVYGGTLNVDVYKSATSTITFWTKAAGVSAGTEIKTSEFVNGKPAITTTQAKSLTGDVTEDAPSLDGFFTAPIQSVTKTATDSMSVQKSDADTTAVTITKGAEYHVLYTYDPDASAAANKGAKKGDALKAVFAQVNVQGKATASTDDSGTTSNY
ncbi:S-layer protein [Levilactobacillus brevis]|uniref:S-layer protein n=1 Tax=Levilactobacillus brevis TaxID=1580 RepID=UPI00336A3BDB